MPILSMNPLKKAKFLTSVAKKTQMIADQGAEVAFVGRSNCGKSSLINALTEQGKLAKTSKTPGRTQMINFFEIDEQTRLVDLPGYGFAKVNDSMREKWERLLTMYLETRESLKGIVVINDIRHPLKDSDRMMLEWNAHFGLDTLLVLNKADKLTRNHINKTVNAVKRDLGDETSIEVIAVSALRSTGLEEIRAWIDTKLS